MGDFFDPFGALAGAAGKLAADTWTAAMLGLWNAGLWLLRLALTLVDYLLTPDLSETGPGAWLYQIMFWIAAALVLIMSLVQLGTAVIKRDGASLARVALGLGQFLVVWGGWIAYGITIVTAAGGLTRALMAGLLHVDSWSAWQPWTPLTPSDVTDATTATVLGLLGLLLWLAAIGHLLVLLVRAAALMVLVATTPIAAAGLVAEAGRSWFWKSLRWFHAAALSPVLMVMVLGVGVQFTTGVATGHTGVQGAIGTAVPGVILICIATVSPLALFKLLSFVDPATTSGASMRASLAAVGGLQGLLTNPATGSNRAASTDDQGRSVGEDDAADATSSRFNAAVQTGMGRLGPAGQLAGRGLGLVAGLGAAGASLGADITNQMGVGHNTYPPDFSLAGRRATYPPSNPQPNPTDPNSSGQASDDGGGSSGVEGYPDADAAGPAGAGSYTTTPTRTPPPGLSGRPTPPPTAGTGGGVGVAAGEASAADAAVLIL